MTAVEDVFHEGGPRSDKPLRRGTIAAVIANPFAGAYVEDIAPFMETLKPLGLSLAQQLLKTLDVPVSEIESYGKGAIVGANGELEHGALWHVPGGYAMRELLGWKSSDSSESGQPDNALAIVPSTKKVGGIGASLDVPLTHINAIYVRSHFDAVEVRIPDGPRADEIVVVLAMGTGARVHARVGGLAASDISQWDGLR
ncbi:amino acid synthesis family protein [Rhodococcus jostii]|uniref:Amino acid synthesis family protein n=1 Tax=Rhodococcus jostii TaxID=132919 RepID=A0ABU4CUS1_RHOJO|nr:amino acid synthesis family protein [Rhodococcus jostii]MDV6286975.1 amino acid synthesis family protein [Rhodococcus jostii]